MEQLVFEVLLHPYICCLLKCARVYHYNVLVCRIEYSGGVPYEAGGKCPYVFFELVMCFGM